MAENRVSAVLTQTDLTNIATALDTIKSKLPFLIDLTPEQRHALLKLGEKSESFVTKSLDLATKNDSFLPRSFDVAEMQKDVNLYFALRSILGDLRRLTEGVDDTLLEVGSEAYTAALVVYRSAKDNGMGQSLDGDLDELGKKFARKSAKPAPEPKPVQ
jgi:hypothetical protein